MLTLQGPLQRNFFFLASAACCHYIKFSSRYQYKSGKRSKTF